MDNKLEKYITVEILEKIYRLKKFINYYNYIIKEDANDATIEVFEKALEKLLNNLAYPVNVLKAKSISTEERIAINRRLSTIFHTIKEFHFKLRYIYANWVRPETYTFTKGLSKKISSHKLPHNINIVLSDEYTFKENNLINKFNEVFKTSQIAFEPDEIICPTFFLPKIEYSNPLNWSILAHELGHLNSSEIDSFVGRTDLIPPNTEIRHQQVLRKWAEEIYCDIFASNLLGPAYFASFVSFALVTTGLGGNSTASYSHPSNMLRIRILHEHLTRNNSTLPIEINDESVEMNAFFHEMIEDFDKVDRKLLRTNVPNDFEIENLTYFIDYIRATSREFNHGLTLDINELKIIQHLKDRLKVGVTIGSYNDYDKSEVLSNLSSGNCDFNSIKSTISERGTSIREILNAGWVNKVANHFPTMVEFVFSEKKINLFENLEQMGDLIYESDDRLLKSIETSELFNLIEVE